MSKTLCIARLLKDDGAFKTEGMVENDVGASPSQGERPFGASVALVHAIYREVHPWSRAREIVVCPDIPLSLSIA